MNAYIVKRMLVLDLMLNVERAIDLRAHEELISKHVPE